MKIPHKFCFTPEEAAPLLGKSQVTVKRWIMAGTLPAFRISEREYRILREDLLEALGEPAERCFLPEGIAFTRPFLARLLDCSESLIKRAQTAGSNFWLREVVHASEIEAFITRNLLFPPEQSEAA